MTHQDFVFMLFNDPYIHALYSADSKKVEELLDNDSYYANEVFTAFRACQESLGRCLKYEIYTFQQGRDLDSNSFKDLLNDHNKAIEEFVRILEKKFPLEFQWLRREYA